MSRIRGENTKPELMLRKALRAAGMRYRLKNKLPGRPDIIFPGKRVAVFVDGCFWHRCPEHFQAPLRNALFWDDKISRNEKRDRKVDEQLSAMGWRILRIWEHEVRGSPQASVLRIRELMDKEQ